MSENKLGYQLPHEDIYELANAELAPVFKMDHKGNYAILLHRNQYKSITELMQEELKLAGLRINPLINISSRESYYHKLTILEIRSGIEYEVSGLEVDGKYCKVTWNPSQTKAAFYKITALGVELWYIDMETKKAVGLSDAVINVNLGHSPVWLMEDSILVNQVIENRPPVKYKTQEAPIGPVISENDGKAIETRTYQDLLKDKIDEFNFELLTTSEIWKYEISGIKSKWKTAAIHDGISVSPDGKYVMLSEIKKPFSYFVPFDRFAYSTYIHDVSGNFLDAVVESPLLDFLPQGFMAVQKGKRQIRWRYDQASTICWVEALDEGDPANEVQNRDAVYQQRYPFIEEARLLFKTEDRFAGLYFSNADYILYYERWWANRKQRMIIINEKNNEKYVINERDFQDKYNDPGNPLVEQNEYLWNVIKIENDQTIYLSGDGNFPGGRKPFIDKYNFITGAKERIYESNLIDEQEDIMGVIDIVKGDVYTLIQSKNKYPNFYLRNIFTASLQKLRHFENPFYKMENVQKEILTYKRADGVELNAVLYLPPDYNRDKGEKLPLLMWAYPTEYKNKDTAGQNLNADNDFIYPFWSSPLYWVLRGYAILDNVSFPIIGENDDQPNETFTQQLIANAKAAIDCVAELGIADKSRVAIGGHSYGAFMVAMLLTHSDLFVAGIARSGAYNRTLTPFGFQSEERNYWQAKEVYDNMNPFMDADKMKTPLLLIHGEADNNSGTFTMQTERYYAALKANGAKVRMVLLPYESHGYVSKENIMHMLWEQDEWLEKYVKQKQSILQ